MSATDYEAWQETAYLFRSPANTRRLLDAIEQSESSQSEHRLVYRVIDKRLVILQARYHYSK